MNPHPLANPGQIVRLNAAAACDGTGLLVRPVSVLAQASTWPSLRILALGRPEEVDHHPAAPAAIVHPLPNRILTPALINAHTHLDLTHVGPQPHDPGRGFVSWVDMVRAGRHHDPELIAASVRRGIELSLASGVVAVGDIAGAPGGNPSLIPFRTLQASPLRGTSFLEFFGIGLTVDRARERVSAVLDEATPSTARVRLGLQPHAPNTVDLRLYRWAAETGLSRSLPLATHLSETPEEHDFIATAQGPQRHFLERMGIWHDSILDHIGRGRHPVQHLRDILSSAPFLVAHVNNADDAAIHALAQTQTSVVYCPRASSYFGVARHFGPHRYQDMLRAGVNICLGTDSIINLPTAALSILDEARILFRRDHADPVSLLRMITINAAAALGIDSSLFRLQSGTTTAGLVAIPIPAATPEAMHPFEACLQPGNDASPDLL